MVKPHKTLKLGGGTTWNRAGFWIVQGNSTGQRQAFSSQTEAPQKVGQLLPSGNVELGILLSESVLHSTGLLKCYGGLDQRRFLQNHDKRLMITVLEKSLAFTNPLPGRYWVRVSQPLLLVFPSNSHPTKNNSKNKAFYTPGGHKESQGYN